MDYGCTGPEKVRGARKDMDGESGIMDVSELQGVVSACLDLIEGLKKENSELTEAVRQLLKKQGETDRKLLQNEYDAFEFRCRIAHLMNREKLLMRKIHPETEAASGPEEKESLHFEAKKPSQPDPGNSPRFEGKGVVYSVITGGYDEVSEAEFKNPALDYILYTDNPELRSDTWEVRFLDNPDGLDRVRLARQVKILTHRYLPEYDYSIYIDGKLKMKTDLTEFVNRYRNEQPLLCFPHYFKDCAYEEMENCIAAGRFDNEAVMRSQMDHYREEGYPVHNGLIDSCFLVREHMDPEVIRVMETWWGEIRDRSVRDQLSFNYACWKNGFLYDTTDLFVYRNPYVAVKPHGAGS
ncbi:MAG: DUF616 domain-containing protein [Lachnospiraceae bacterium]|nr:DUF616 domain-containing protein [Lachnospiraceae bacterium]